MESTADKGYNKPIKLTNTNYLGWSQKLENYLDEKKLSKYLEHNTFDEYWQTRIVSDQELRYNRKILDAGDNQNTIDELERLFHHDLSLWSQQKLQQQQAWEEESNKLQQ